LAARKPISFDSATAALPDPVAKVGVGYVATHATSRQAFLLSCAVTGSFRRRVSEQAAVIFHTAAAFCRRLGNARSAPAWLAPASCLSKGPEAGAPGTPPVHSSIESSALFVAGSRCVLTRMAA